MAFRVPTFNLLCNLWAPLTAFVNARPIAIRRANVPCALVYGRRTNGGMTPDDGDTSKTMLAMSLLVGKGEDIRGFQDTISQDLVECPAGSGRFYGTGFVDDIGKGYANEHRFVYITPLFQTWVAPYA